MIDDANQPSLVIRAFEQTPTDQMTTRMLFDYADALRLIGRKTAALSIYEQLKNLNEIPEQNSWLIPLFRGQTLMEMGQWMLAEASFREAFNLHSRTTVTFVFLASALTAQEKFSDAIGILEKAIDVDGDQDEVFLNLALNLRAIGDLTKARDCVVRSLHFDSDNSDARELLADLEAVFGAAES